MYEDGQVDLVNPNAPAIPPHDEEICNIQDRRKTCEEYLATVGLEPTCDLPPEKDTSVQKIDLEIRLILD